jgi:hypothetical protein
MPVISMFYGIIIFMYFFDNKQHKLPHIHVKYQEQEAVFSRAMASLDRNS